MPELWLYIMESLGPKMKKYTKLLILLGITNLFGFEVNTHQAITRCAIIVNSPNCQTEGSKNLLTFSKNSNLAATIYADEIFDKYNLSYKQYANIGKGFKPYEINIVENYTGIIEAGSVLEDSVYHNAKLALPTGAGDGRFNNHYYAAQAETRATCLAFGDQHV